MTLPKLNQESVHRTGFSYIVGHSTKVPQKRKVASVINFCVHVWVFSDTDNWDSVLCSCKKTDTFLFDLFV